MTTRRRFKQVTSLKDRLIQEAESLRRQAQEMPKGWLLDISADVAAELRRRCDLQVRDIPSSLQICRETL
jgi:hypothetical protein